MVLENDSIKNISFVLFDENSRRNTEKTKIQIVGFDIFDISLGIKKNGITRTEQYDC